MKGKATITLCDAASGRVVKQIEEHNMVTNALSSIFQPPKLAALGGMDFSRVLSGCLPMSKSLIGGLVLLGENVAENASDFMLKPENSVVGHAGDAYSGTEATRGTLNANESYATENGYHFTWDFPTDKANGVIRCCALTNKQFGNIGRSLENTDGSLLVNPMYTAQTSQSITGSLATQAAGHFVGMYEEGILTFLKASGGELVRTKVKLVNPNGVLINDALGGVVIAEENLAVPFCPSNAGVYFVDSENRLVYFFKTISTDVTVPSTYVGYYAVDPLTGEVPVYDSVDVRDLISMQGAAVFGGHFFQFANSGLNVYGLNGQQAASYEFTGSKFFVYGGKLWVVGKKGSVSCIMCFASDRTSVFDSDRVNYTRNILNIPVESSFVSPPYTLHTQGNANNNGVQLMMFTNYLATINNLSEPIEKTSAQTLKVTYDITNT